MFVLSETPSIANHFIAELRDIDIQKDRMRFRRNMERLGEMLAYEVSKSLTYETAQIQTPLGVSETLLLEQQPVLGTILRAGLPMYQGFVNVFDRAESAFIGAYRGKPNDDYSFDIEMQYTAMPDLEGKVLILIDPMLATGKSVIRTLTSLRTFGKPASLHLVSAIATPEGVNYVQQYFPEAKFWIGALDESLNHKYYIVPGLGDAGDLAFGEKM
ncbi:uracil phosphoribosyltransferase [Cytophagaceae bacterium DM2B3-1]|uniref:Uracil phosphoribosyltransferase n=1 Tax=Xanthocytophaga flava TaxID=3048013 RepID=A0AAE3QWC7_9BACT|nr:uracil phosphoribosyltransferase [Xanthocytophaga flavus]MDJ1471975.1 uracil phosphoribosyltransferase [Xanthocytophaga flavus]MDJ1484685.1 uracil phosphoribosyltransferase [Xanthocytophaga flavus]MDJ1496912.1 uracil phosphoribosyltransferase [Xanthocytophaga flavus]